MTLKKLIAYKCRLCQYKFESANGKYHDATLFEKGYYLDICPHCGFSTKSFV